MVDVDDCERLLEQPDLALALRTSRQNGMLHLGFAQLRDCKSLLLSHDLRSLVRLDLGHNELHRLPKEIGNLKRLEQLWVNGNHELMALPDELGQCKKLKVIDARETSLVKLPPVLGTLDHLFWIDLRDVPTLKMKVSHAYWQLASFLKKKPSPEMDEPATDELEYVHELPQEALEPYDPLCLNREAIGAQTKSLIIYLKRRYDTKQLKKRLEERFVETLYRDLSDTEDGLVAIRALIKIVFREFDDLDDIKDVIRNCERLFPEKIDDANVRKMKAKFMTLRRENERKKLAARLELKLRAVYFDRIDPSAVEGIVKSIYGVIEQLQDIKFLIKHATQIFPENAGDINADQVFQNLKDMRQKIAEERAAAINIVNTALRSLYAHVEPENVRKATEGVCKFFKNVEDLKKLAADASVYFPSEFENVVTNPKSVHATFVQAENEES